MVESDKKCDTVVEKKKKENPFLKIEELQLNHEKAMAAMKTELAELKNAILNGTGNANPSGGNNVGYAGPPHQRKGRRPGNRRRRCDKCEREDALRCYHCFSCGSAEHRFFSCPDRQKNE